MLFHGDRLTDWADFLQRAPFPFCIPQRGLVISRAPEMFSSQRSSEQALCAELSHAATQQEQQPLPAWALSLLLNFFPQFLGKHFIALYLSECLSKHLRQHLINGIFKPSSSFCKSIACSWTAAVEQGDGSAPCSLLEGAEGLCMLSPSQGKDVMHSWDVLLHEAGKTPSVCSFGSSGTSCSQGHVPKEPGAGLLRPGCCQTWAVWEAEIEWLLLSS